MKTLKALLLLATFAIVAWSCKDQLEKATLKSEVAANELQSPSSDTYVLTLDDKANTMETFKWSATDYGFKAAVTYTLQMAAGGTDFAAPVDVVSTNELKADVTVGAFNDLCLSIGLLPEVAGTVDLRVRSVINDAIGPVYSNTRTITVTDYATSFPPIWGMGSALKGWGPWPDNAVEWQSSEYKKYSTITYITAGGTSSAFRWFAQLDWGPTSYNYDFFTGGVGSLLGNAMDGDHNFYLTGSTGWYKVDLDLNAKTVDITAVDEPQLWIMGAGVNGWGPWPDNGVKMTYLKPGIFQATVNFGVAGETWRFFAQPDWSPTSYNYPYFTGGVIPQFENALDGDLNFRNVGTPGILKITANLNDKTVTLDPVLYMMGAALKGWGPWPDNEISMTYDGDNKFSATTNFTNGQAWRFFAQENWSPTSYNYPYFTGGVASDFSNANDGDLNFLYTGATGSRTIHVDMTAKSVTLD